MEDFMADEMLLPKNPWYHKYPLDEPFDENELIYTYSRELFRETVQAALERDLWIDTHEGIYKYIRERNALRVTYLDDSEMDHALAADFSGVRAVPVVMLEMEKSRT